MYDDVSLLRLQRPPVTEARALLEQEPFSWAGEVGEDGFASLERLVGSGAVLREVKELVELHATLFEAPIGLRVALTESPMCPAFHVDRVHCRAIVTLAGAGTQWLSGNLSAVRDDVTPEALAEGEVGWFKGTAWPGAAPVVHRSPPGRGRRLVLTMDLL